MLTVFKITFRLIFGTLYLAHPFQLFATSTQKALFLPFQFTSFIHCSVTKAATNFTPKWTHGLGSCVPGISFFSTGGKMWHGNTRGRSVRWRCEQKTFMLAFFCSWNELLINFKRAINQRAMIYLTSELKLCVVGFLTDMPCNRFLHARAEVCGILLNFSCSGDAGQIKFQLFVTHFPAHPHESWDEDKQEKVNCDLLRNGNEFCRRKLLFMGGSDLKATNFLQSGKDEWETSNVKTTSPSHPPPRTKVFLFAYSHHFSGLPPDEPVSMITFST